MKVTVVWAVLDIRGFNKRMKISPSIFRAYDIRGVVQETLTPDAVYAIGQAIGSEALARGQQQVVIARDGRLSGSKLSAALRDGLLASGRDVIDIGAVPTPVLYFAAHTLGTHSGVMLTGSHNPPEYNGLKIVLNGETLAEEAIQSLYQRIVDNDFTQGQGHYETRDIVPDYISRITSDLRLARSLKIVIDSGNGIAGAVAPKLFRALGCEVVELFCEVDGRFPNHHPDPGQPENLQDLTHSVLAHQADIGLAFDGDGDRLGVVTDNGEIIWPDRQMMLYAEDVLKRNPAATILYDVKCTRHLASVIDTLGGKPLMWKTGHSLIKAKMRETGALLAGEMSGHIFFKERWFGFDDGLYTAVRLLEILAADKRSASEIFKTLPNSVNTPELKLPMDDARKSDFMTELQQQAQFPQAVLNTIDGLRVDFSDGWGLIRQSNTTPCLVLRFEADTTEGLQRIQALFRTQLLALDAQLALPF
jgi:phosphomannomutase/phosphoglucomutase